MTTTALPSLKTAICKSCGQMFAYEPFYGVNNVDFGNPAGICDECETRRIQDEAAAERERQAAAIEDNIRLLIPDDIRETDRTHPGFNRPLWEAVRKWRPSDETRWLGIIGHAGKSKTRCMAMLCMQAMRAGIRCQWTTAIRLKEAAADRRHTDSRIAIPAREHLADCRRSGWLFIDDLGKQGEWSPAFESVIFELLDHRSTNRLATVFSSNAHPEEFSQLISPINASPIIGRLLDRTHILQVSA